MEPFEKTCDEKVCPVCLTCGKGTSEFCGYVCKKCRISELENDLHSLVVENEKLKADLKMLDFCNEQYSNYLSEDYHWLMEQAECIDKLELEINDLRAEVQKWQQFYNELEESHLETKELLKNIVNQNKRLREDIIKAISDIEMLNLYKAKKTLMEALNNDEN